MIMKQKIESFRSASAEWSVASRQQEAKVCLCTCSWQLNQTSFTVSTPTPQRALGEFPEKELQLQQMEVQGQGVLSRTSEEGRVHIVRDIKRLQESWLSLYNMSLNLHR